MGYSPENNPYVPGDPYSYDLKWVVDKIKPIRDIEAIKDQAAASAEAAEDSAIRSKDSADDAAASAATLPAYKNQIDAEISTQNDTIARQDADIVEIKGDINVLDARVDQITNLPVGSTAGDAELIDARIGYKGYTYDNAGDAVRYQCGDLDSELMLTADAVGTANLGWKYGITLGKKLSGGSLVDDATFVTTDYIPVTPNGDYHLTVTGSGTYELIRETYDNTQTLIANNTIYVSETDRGYTAPSNVYYVRFSVKQTVYFTRFWRFSTIKNTIDELKASAVETAYVNDVVGSSDMFNPGIIPGQVLVSGGSTNNDGNMVTTDFIPVTPGLQYMLERPGQSASYTLHRCTYAADKSYIAYTSLPAESPIRTWQPDANVAYVRFSVSKTVLASGIYFRKVNNNIKLLKMYSNPNAKQFNYDGDALDLEMPNKCLISKLFSQDSTKPAGTEPQAIAIYNGIIFQMYADNICRLYDLYTGETISQISITSGHGNSAVFTDIWDDPDNDEFPLLIISDDNGYAYVNKVTRSSATLQATFVFPQATYGYCPQFALIDNETAWIVGNTSSGTSFPRGIFTKVDLTDTTLVGPDQYQPAVITSFEMDIPQADSVLQGVSFCNGKLYVASGAESNPDADFINVIDPEAQSIVSTIENFPAELLAGEIEDIEFAPNKISGKYDIIVMVRLVGYFRITA